MWHAWGRDVCSVLRPERDHLEDTHRWEGNIKTDLDEVVGVGVDWIALAQDRDRWEALVNAVMHFGFHITRAKVFTSRGTVSFSR